MDIRLRIWIVVLAVGMAFWIYDMIRRERYAVRYSLPWILSLCGVIVLALFPSMVQVLAQVLGIADAANAVFFLAIGLLVVNIIIVSVALSRTRAQVVRLTQEVALLRAEGDQQNDKALEDD